MLQLVVQHAVGFWRCVKLHTLILDMDGVMLQTTRLAGVLGIQ